MDSSVTSVLVEWWLGGIVVLFMATVSGFLAGLWCARMAHRRAELQSRSSASQLMQTLLKSLDTARELCVQLEKTPQYAMPAEACEQLSLRRGGLLESLSRLINRAVGVLPLASNEPAPNRPKPFQVEWVREPVDPDSELPDRVAFETNLSAVLEASTEACRDSSLLLIRVDKMPALVARYGRPNAEKLIKRLASVVCRAARDDDLVCRCNSETLGIIFPGLDIDAGARLGRVIRDSIRNYHFHMGETGPEVIVTASFGCTPCRPEENAELVLNRAFDAVSKSQRLGRNQLHVHDGQALVHCFTV